MHEQYAWYVLEFVFHAGERDCHKLKQSKLVTTPNGSVQVSVYKLFIVSISVDYYFCFLEKLANSHNAEDNMKNGEALQDHLDEGEKERHPYTWSDAKHMTKEELDSVEKSFLSADECAITLVFSNQSTQLRERKVVNSRVHIHRNDCELIG